MYEYDVAFSFAGEEREYVDQTFLSLDNKGIKVFYDRNHAANLWGQDLYQYLSDIYQNKAKYCVVFLSENYAKKLWTRHELKSIQARAFQESREYILPARFDQTEIPGLLPTIGYIDLNEFDPDQLASLISQKLGQEGNKEPRRLRKA